MLRVLSFYAPDPEAVHGLWGHPIEGIVCHTDLTKREVLRFVDTGYMNVPEDSSDYIDPAITGPTRETMKPLNITQPEGASCNYSPPLARFVDL